ncbi:MAG: SPOR domain-containing protein [Candidatus Omnitrophica bacterium]|nr:SPOR domain-containing protein [Candidatus Omnitrophota bacterium]
MELFNKSHKKDDQLRTLSEDEIQKKLYGSLKTTHPNKILSSENRKKKPPLVKLSEGQPPKDQDKEEELGELFSESPGKENHANDALDRIEDEAISKEKSTTDVPIRKWVQKEQDTLAKLTPKGKIVPGRKKKDTFAVGKGLGFIFAKIWSFVQFAFLGLIRLMASIDFKKLGSGRLAYWTGAILFIGAILIGIHFLNVQRETAMKAPKKPVITYPESTDQGKRIPTVLEKTSATDLDGNEMMQGPKESIAESTITENTEATTSGAQIQEYVIQIATYANESDASRSAARLMSDGLPAFVHPLSRTGGRVYYCVFLGGYESYRRADAALEQFKLRETSKPFQDAFVRKLTR